MKKIYLCLSVVLLSLLYACTHNNLIDNSLPKTLKEAVIVYNDKLTTLIKDEKVEASHINKLGRFYNNTPYNPEDMLPRETYLAIYDKQIDNMNHVYLTDYLLQYKMLLDDINIILESFDVDEVEVNIQIDFKHQPSIEANVFLSKDQGIVLKLTALSYYTKEPIHYGIKLGYEHGIFFVKELAHYKKNNSYNYFEFLEGVSLIDINYRDQDNYRYQYRNQVDHESFEVYLSDDGWNDNYSLSWFNPKTNIRTTYADGSETIRHFELFNEKTSIFSYSDYLNGKMTLRFQLLEATGWDYAYLDSNAHRNEGVYKHGVMLFEPDEYRQFNVDLNHVFKYANVGVMIDLNSDKLTNDILSHKIYDMDFNHPEITKDYINQTIASLYEESKHLAVYRGIDFYSGNIKDILYREIDDDLKEASQ